MTHTAYCTTEFLESPRLAKLSFMELPSKSFPILRLSFSRFKDCPSNRPSCVTGIMTGIITLENPGLVSTLLHLPKEGRSFNKHLNLIDSLQFKDNVLNNRPFMLEIPF